ncbi:MAG: nucleotidyltransferase domain-containing protein, partial [Nanoarchaeota archaeon]|nr:nucleotidyltransferase domain-containing protein [Nanoarchaeota archaeon]
MSYILRCKKRGLINPPKHVTDGIQYEVLMGSQAYGVASAISDMDIYGFSIPKKEMLFPHLKGEIQGFGRQ